jgi:exo-beta-1,3-glucanase (GH17 family)
MNPFPYKPAINYSGYREDQSPRYRTYPSKEEILEDLRILEGDYYYLRIYDCSPHAYRTMEVIEENSLDFKVMLGLSLRAEVNHENHPYFYHYPEKQLNENKIANIDRVTEIIAFAKRYKKYVSAISIGNEIRSMWSNNRVSEVRLVQITKRIQLETNIPVTYCEEYQHWVEGLDNLAKQVDFISLHTYPAWQGCKIEDSLSRAVENFHEVQDKYPDKYYIITETGWPTLSHGSKIKIEDATIENQVRYNKEISDWGKKTNTLVYLFEAFDEPWKGGKHPDEPEKHWGIYYVNRTKK